MLSGLLSGDTTENVGTIKGVVLDKHTLSPISAALVTLLDGEQKVSDVDGKFEFYRVPVGAYSLKVQFDELPPSIKTDVMVRPNRITTVRILFDTTPVISEKMSVTGSYFDTSADTPQSDVSFTQEEIRRAAGGAGDISRMLTALPSVIQTTEMMNGLVVRGGNPSENSFYVDNIEITNVNHFPGQGTSTGTIGLVNTDFIQDVNFKSGGFDASFGNKLSAVMNMTFREGNREEFDIQLDLNMAGFGGILEGPLGKKASVMLSLRRSYLDFVAGLFGNSLMNSVPRFGDIQGKLVLDLSPRHKLQLLGIWGDDTVKFDKDKALENSDFMYGDMGSSEYTFGLNWQYVWKKGGYSETSISHNRTRYNQYFIYLINDQPFYSNTSIDQQLTLRNVNHIIFNYFNKAEVGFEIKRMGTNYDYFIDPYDIEGGHSDYYQKQMDSSTNIYAGFVSFNTRILKPFVFNLGLRVNYCDYNQNTNLSPRFSIGLPISLRTQLYGAFGIYAQNLPLVLLFQNEAFKSLRTPLAYHYILGFKHIVAETVQLTIEAYDKEYRHFPMDLDHPEFFFLDKALSEFSGELYIRRDQLTDSGRAFARGIEFTLQKKLKSKLYGVLNLGISKTRYQTPQGHWIDRIFDTRFVFAVQGGFKPNNHMEFSIKWTYAGGLPYTPYDVEASTAQKTEVYDLTQVNQLRRPDYHTLNIRFDKRFFFKRSNLIVFVSIWNVYNRLNYSFSQWNNFTDEEKITYQWGIIPIGGFEFEF